MLHLISNEESALKRANTFAHERATPYICSQMSNLRSLLPRTGPVVLERITPFVNNLTWLKTGLAIAIEQYIHSTNAAQQQERYGQSLPTRKTTYIVLTGCASSI